MIYLIVPLSMDISSLQDAIESGIPAENRHKLQEDRGWLIKFDGTTVELCNRLRITGQTADEPAKTGSAIVVPVNNYYGRGPADMWEWLASRFDR